MIKGIFCHELPIYKDVNGVYCSNTLTDALFSRYLQVVDELIIATRVYPLSTIYSEAGQEKITLKSVRFLDLPNLNTPKAMFEKRSDVKRLLENEIKEVDLVFIRGGFIALIGMDIAKKLGKPYLLECGGDTWDAYWYHSLRGKLIAPYMEIKNKIAARNAAMVIYVTQEWLQKKYPTKGIAVAVSDVFIDENKSEILDNRYKRIEKYGSNQIILGTTAAIDVKYKGHKYVIKAISMLKNDIDIRYEIAGGGKEDYLRKISERYGVSNKIFFKGQLTHDEVLNWLDTIDIYIQPSLAEGLPRALVEAMSRGCPAIGSNIAGIPELLNKKYLFRKRRTRELAKILKNLSNIDLISAAEENYNQSRNYSTDVLDKKRSLAFKEYRRIALGEKV